MIRLLKFRQFVKGNIEILLLSLVVATFFLKENINSFFLIIYVIYWFVKKKYRLIEKNKLQKLKWYLIFVFGYIALIIIGTFYSYNLDKAIDFLLKQLTILAFPVLILGIKWDRKQIIVFNSIFISSVFLFVLFLYAVAVVKMIDLNSLYIADPNHPTWKYYLFTSGRLSPEIHPTYLSVFIIYSIFCVISFMKTEKLFYKPIYYFTLFYFIATLILLSSRGALFSLLLVFFANEIYKLLFKKSMDSFFKITLVIILIIAVFSNTSVLHRISKLKNIVNKDLVEVANINNSSGKRAQLYLIANSVIKDHFFFGVGTKNWENTKKEYYNKYYKQDFAYSIMNLNTHNQYLNSMISWGVFGGILLLILILFQIHFSYKANRIELILFWCFFALVLLTENILDRHRGIIFFSMLSAYTIGLYLGEEGKDPKTEPYNILKQRT